MRVPSSKSNPPTRSFPVEKENDIIIPSQEDKNMGFPQETNSNSMTITKKGFRLEWRPNNYRRQIKVKIKSDSTLIVLSKHFKNNCVIGVRNKLFFTKSFVEGVTLQYGKDTLVAMYPQKYVDGEKEVFIIEDKSLKVCEDWVISKREEIKELLDNCLKTFSRKFGIINPIEKPIWSRHEDWTIDEEIKKIPEWEIIQGQNIKKVYPRGIEFTGGKGEVPTTMLLTRFRNSALKDFAPDIVLGMESLLINQNPLAYLRGVVKSVDGILLQGVIIENLGVVDRLDFELWVFKKFGIQA